MHVKTCPEGPTVYKRNERMMSNLSTWSELNIVFFAVMRSQKKQTGVYNQKTVMSDLNFCRKGAFLGGFSGLGFSMGILGDSILPFI